METDMIKTTRTLEVSKDNAVRIISAPNGEWQMQRFVKLSETNKWLNAGPATNYNAAKAEAGHELRESW
jgi:hypothetical protein